MRSGAVRNVFKTIPYALEILKIPLSPFNVFLTNTIFTIPGKAIMLLGPLSRLVVNAFDTFLFVPNHTTQKGAHIRDGVDLKRTMVCPNGWQALDHA